MANETEKTILPYLNVLEVETIDKSNVTKVIVIDKDDEVKVMDGSQLGTNSYFDIQNKPEINGVELNGSMTSDELGIPSVEGVDNQITEKLADYPTKEEVTAEITEATAGKQNTLVQGDGIVIEENTVSADYNTIRNKPSLNGTELSGAASIVPAINIQSVPSKVTLAPVFGNQTGEAVELPIYNTETNQAGIVNGPLYAQLADKYTKAEIDALNTAINKEMATKQDTLVSGTNIKTINNESLLGEGNITIDAEIPYLVIYPNRIAYGDFDAVYKSIQENKPCNIYLYGELSFYFIAAEMFGISGANISAAFHSETSGIHRLHIATISSTSVTTQDLTFDYQEKLVSGTNIKTINDQDILGEGNIVIDGGSSIPYLVINDTTHLSGDFNAVFNAISNKTPYNLYYVNILGYNDLCTPEVVFASGSNIQATFHFEYGTTNHTLVTAQITPTGVSVDKSYHNYQEQLVSGTNIKTVNGESLLGSGNIDIESVSNPVTYGSGTQPQVHTILVVTQSEYDAISSKDPNTQYLIVE